MSSSGSLTDSYPDRGLTRVAEATLLEAVRVAVVRQTSDAARGAEMVFNELARAFPQADLFRARGDNAHLSDDLAGRPYQAIGRRLDLTSYDLVVSAGGLAHGIKSAKSSCHVAYAQSPDAVGTTRRRSGARADAVGTTRRRSGARADAIATTSAASAHKVRDAYGRESTVVHPPVDVDAFGSIRAITKEDFVVAAGELVGHKRVEVAIEACALAKLPLLVVGDGPERDRLQRLADELDADVRFTGRVEESEYRRLLAAARVFVHAGVEDFGTTTVEALAAGTPVVGIRAGGTGEIVTDGTGILVDEQSPSAFAEALQEAWKTRFDTAALRARAADFRPEVFHQAIREFVAAEFARTRLTKAAAVRQELAAIRSHRQAEAVPSMLTVGAKRAIDIVGALVGIVLLSPVLLAVSCAVVASTHGPVFFRQQRVGHNAKRFRIFKFRTMHMHAEAVLHRDQNLYAQYVANGYKLPPDVDPRVTRLGKMLRKLSLDELPQLFNVLTGDMTLVGPRPVVPDELAQYEDYTHFYLDVRPGMTGAWQTGGRSHVDYPERAQIDADYVAGWTFWGDIKILLLTVPAVLRREGAH